MADYWKSQPRKFCQYCKCWIADNKPSIDFHERGKNHKENVAAKFNDIRKKSVNKAKQEAKQSKQLATMEEAAKRAYEKDLKRLEMEASGIYVEEPSNYLPDMMPPPSVAAISKNQLKKLKKQQEKAVPINPETLEWIEAQSNYGQTYYYNNVTGESRWEKPACLLPPPKPAKKKPPPASVWVEAASPDGNTYHYNTQTGETSWERRPGFPSDAAGATGGEGESGTEKTSEPQPSSSEAAIEPEKDDGTQVNIRKRKADNEPFERVGEAAGSSVSEETKVENQTEAAEKTEEVMVQPRRRVNPYGAWERVKVVEKKPEKYVDLQLPKVQSEAAPPPPPDVPPEPKPKFKERIITSLGVEGGPVAFKKKAQNGKTRSLRQRDADD